MRFTSMDMDSPKGPAPSELVMPSLHACDTCAAAFVTPKALDAHCRATNKQRSALTKYIGSCLVCPVCFMAFSTRTRLLAHVNEQRNRGKRLVTCNTVLRACLVAPVPDGELVAASENDKSCRKETRQRGHTTPLSTALARRPRVGATLAEQQQLYHSQPPGVKTALPANALQFFALPPLKRIRTKSSADLVLLQHVQ